MRVLVTGGAGFVGTNLVEALSKDGHEISILDNFSRSTAQKNLPYIKQTFPKVEIIKADVRDFDSVLKASQGKDVIFNFAAQVAVTTSVQNPREDFEINALGTLNALEAARKNDCGVILTSTNKVYGDNVNRIPITEGAMRYDFSGDFKGKGVPETFSIDADEHSPYGCSKLAADVYTRDYAAIYGVPTAVNRMSCIYGLHQYGTEDQGWVAHMIISALLGKKINVYGDGKQIRDLLFGSDLAKLYVLEAKNLDRIKGQAFNVGGGPQNTLSLLELFEILRSFGLKVNTSYSEWRPADQKVYYSDISKVSRTFNWSPSISAPQGVKMLYEWTKINAANPTA